jgi:leucyl-tRNA synthetase
MNAFASTTHYCKRRKKEPVSAENLPFDACNESVNDRTTSKLEAKEQQQQQQQKCRCCTVTATTATTVQSTHSRKSWLGSKNRAATSINHCST